MSKVFAINFDDSEEELYQWITRTPNAEKIIKRFIVDEMNKNLSKAIFTVDDLNEIAKKAKELFAEDNKQSSVSSKDLKAMFDDDSFWD